ncbi:beta strand repeat-containing protein [Thalassoroseus pseudoceratinae]|uniref:beta strand repeat-containing protein n=1 Tax=Thalassoroseus pseudoceratinae TaxID=2713176 RepID=UPI00142090E3|nr:Calx-beta domain-containing protein [Thalassoroseus pseudoceratinae]
MVIQNWLNPLRWRSHGRKLVNSRHRRRRESVFHANEKADIRLVEALEDRTLLTVDVSGIIDVDTVWNDPMGYRLTGDVIVQDGATLTIANGVTVSASSASNELFIGSGSAGGRIDADGVTFTADVVLRSDAGLIQPNALANNTFQADLIVQDDNPSTTNLTGNTFQADPTVHPEAIPVLAGNTFDAGTTVNVSGGTVNVDTTWPLLTNVVAYSLAGDVLVSGGAELTVATGNRVDQANTSQEFFISNDGSGAGLNANGVTFTADAFFEPSATGVLTSNTIIGDFQFEGDSTTGLNVSNNDFQGVVSVHPEFVPLIAGNTFASGTTLTVQGGTVDTDTTWPVIPNVVAYHLFDSVFVSNSSTLTIASGNQVTQRDSNRNFIVSNDSSGAGLVADNVTLGAGALLRASATGSLTNNTIVAVYSFEDGSTSGLTVSGNDFQTAPSVHPEFIPLITGNTFASGTTLTVQGGTVDTDITWPVIPNVVAYHLFDSVFVSNSATLTIASGNQVTQRDSNRNFIVSNDSSGAGLVADGVTLGAGALLRLSATGSLTNNTIVGFYSFEGDNSSLLTVSGNDFQTAPSVHPEFIPNMPGNTFANGTTLSVQGATVDVDTTWPVIPNVVAYSLFDSVFVSNSSTLTIASGNQVNQRDTNRNFIVSNDGSGAGLVADGVMLGAGALLRASATGSLTNNNILGVYSFEGDSTSELTVSGNDFQTAPSAHPEFIPNLSGNTFANGTTLIVQGATVDVDTMWPVIPNVVSYQLFNSVFVSNSATLTIASGNQVNQRDTSRNFIVSNDSSGAGLNANGVTFAVGIFFNGGAAGSLSFNRFVRPISIHGTTTASIHCNDFSAGTATVEAVANTGSGPLDFTDNWWGTTIASQIEDQIFHNADASNRPVVVYEPFLNATPQSISVGVSPAVVDEDGSTNLVFTFTRSGSIDQALDVDFDALGTAVPGVDYILNGATTFDGNTSGTVTFAAGSDTAVLTADPIDDGLFEGSRTVRIVVFAADEYKVGFNDQATGTILEDENQVTISVSPNSIAEDAPGNLVYTFTRSGSTDSALTVGFSTNGSTASSGADYSLLNATSFNGSMGTVTFGVGVSQATVLVDPLADSESEPDETVAFTLLAGAGYVIGSPNTATGTITNVEPTVSVAVSPSEVAEDGPGNLTYTFTRAGDTTGALTIAFSVLGDAVFNSDYTQTGADTFNTNSGTVTIPDGDSSVTVTINPIADTSIEADETVQLSITSAPGYDIGTPSTATATILDDDTRVTVNVSPTAVAENGGTNLVYTFTRVGVVDAPLTVDFNYTGTATAGVDFAPSGADVFNGGSGQITFAGGSSTAVLTVTPIDDNLLEPDETLQISVLNGAGYTVGTPAMVVGTITNDDSEISVSVSPASVLEDGSQDLIYTFTRIGALNSALTVDFAVSGNAVFNTDYTQVGGASFNAGSGSVNFGAGSSIATVVITPTTDISFEPDETVQLLLQSGTGYSLGSPSVATGTIENDDQVISATVSINDVTRSEDNGPAVFTVSLDQAVDVDVNIDFSTLADTADSLDYTAATDTVTIPAGQISTTISVDITADVIIEANEQFFVQLSNVQASGRDVTIADGQGVGTIFNDDGTVSVSIGNTARAEDNGSMTFTVSLNQPSAQEVAVDFNTEFDTAGAADFTPSSGTVTIPAGATTATINVPITSDAVVELDEQFFVQISNAQTGGQAVPITSNRGTGLIINDDSSEVSVGDVTQPEGDQPLVFTVSLTQPFDVNVMVDFVVTDETSGSGGGAGFGGSLSELNAFSQLQLVNGMVAGTVTIPAGFTSATVEVDVPRDNVVTLQKSFKIKLGDIDTGNRNGFVIDDEAIGTVTNVDVGSLTINDVAVDENAAELVFTVSLNAPVDVDLSVDYATQTDSAGANDFTLAPGTLVIPAGSTSVVLVVPITEDNIVELDEQFFINLSNLQTAGRQVNLDGMQGLATIRDDDAATLSISGVSQDENSGPMTFTVSLDNPVDQAVSVSVATATDSADASDFTAIDRQVVIPSGSLTATFNINVLGDEVVELDEEFLINLGNLNAGSRNVGLGVAQVSGVIRNDDFASLSIGDATGSEDAGMLSFPVTLNRPLNVDVSVDFATVVDSAGLTDYSSRTGTLIIPAGTTSAMVDVTLTMDGNNGEFDEQFFVDLSNVNSSGRGVTLNDSRATGTILGDIDAGPAALLSIDDASQTESNGPITFTVSLDNAVDQDVTVDFETIADTADNSDFTSQTGTVTIPAGETSVVLSINLTSDAVAELDEQFFINLSNIQPGSAGVLLDDGQARGTILDDDSATISVNSVETFEGSQGTRLLVFTVTLDGDVDSELTVDFATVAGTATTDDFVSQSGQLTFLGSSGQTQTVIVEVNGDLEFEADENFQFALSNIAAGGRDVTSTNGTGTILNDDLRASQAEIVSESIPNGSINGTYQEVVSGNFDGVPGRTDDADDLFFWDPISGANRIIFGDGRLQNNPIAPGFLNGNDFTEILVGNFDDGGGDDFFFWNPRSGRNRLIHNTAGAQGISTTIETNFIPANAINGNDFTSIVSGNFDGGGPDDLFFWNPTNGRNRLVHLAAIQPGIETDGSVFQTNLVDTTLVNGNSYQNVQVGQFTGAEPDQLLFLNLTTGGNRLVTFAIDTPGGLTNFGAFRTNFVTDTTFNGNDFEQVVVADINGDGLDDVFAWNSRTGRNRIAVSDLNSTNSPSVVSNFITPGAVNGDFDRVVRLRNELFGSGFADELFFWDDAAGLNRIGFA